MQVVVISIADGPKRTSFFFYFFLSYCKSKCSVLQKSQSTGNVETQEGNQDAVRSFEKEITEVSEKLMFVEWQIEIVFL